MSTLASITDKLSRYLKPHRQEAILRVRSNCFGLVVLLVLSYLLPIPSLLSALKHVLFKKTNQLQIDYVPPGASSGIMDEYLCLIETTAFAIFGFNIVEGLYAIQFPHKPSPLPSTPGRPKASAPPSAFLSPPPSTKSFRTLSPNTSPQPQRPFSFSTGPGGSYPSTPISSPSKIMHYNVPPSSSISTSSSLSLSTLSRASPSPSPLVSAFKSRHPSDMNARPLDASYLQQLKRSIKEEDYDPFAGDE